MIGLHEDINKYLRRLPHFLKKERLFQWKNNFGTALPNIGLTGNRVSPSAYSL